MSTRHTDEQMIAVEARRCKPSKVLGDSFRVNGAVLRLSHSADAACPISDD
jgi:hypothetical protein